MGRYRLLNRLGAGGMGRVFLGETPGGRKVAVKYLSPNLSGLPDELRDIISACLTKDPAGRPTLEELLTEFSGAAGPAAGGATSVLTDQAPGRMRAGPRPAPPPWPVPDDLTDRVPPAGLSLAEYRSVPGSRIEVEWSSPLTACCWRR